MGATWTSNIIIALLQIQAVISVKAKAVSGVEGQIFDFRCEYQDSQQNKAKFLSHVGSVSSDHLIRTDKHNEWVRNGRFSLYDNTTGAFFIVRVETLALEDSGMYWCGVDLSPPHQQISVIQLNVSRADPSENLAHYITVSPHFPKAITVDKLHLPLYLAAVMCVTAILIVCLFTLCLLLAIKHRRPGPLQNREISSDYETMMPTVRTDSEFYCSCTAPDCADLSALPPPPPDLCYHLTPKHRESAVTLGLGEYVDLDVPGHICQYQHLDLSRLEEHVYHSLHGNSGPKNGSLRVKEQINC